MKQILNKLKEINKRILIGIAVLMAALSFGFYSSKSNDSFGFKCPSDFTTPEKYAYSIFQWVSEYTKKHPKAKAEEMMAVRDKLLEKNKCGKTPFTLDDSALELIDNNNVNTAKHQELSNPKYFVSKELGFSFAVSDGFAVLVEAEDNGLGNVVVVKTEYARKMAVDRDKEEPLDAVIISARETSPDFSAMSWLKSPNSGYNFAFGYKETVIGGEKAYLLNWHSKNNPDGALFDNPDKTLRFSVVTFGSSPSKEMTMELENILKSFSFNKLETQ